MADSVLVIYTGGTIGSVPRDRTDPLSPLAPAPLEQVMGMLPRYDADSRSILLGRQAVRLETLSWEPPIDSSAIAVTHWVRLAREIKARYQDHVGFVILHGTDTLAYTASVLAYMLDNLSKPVVLTGSQRPIGETRSDAVQNLVTACEIAAAELLGDVVVPEVCVFFRDELLRGCRTTKLSASTYNAFASPNFPPLGRAGEYIEIEARHLRPSTPHALVVRDRLESRIASLDVFPGMSPELLGALLGAGELRGVVLKTFGTGNVPATPGILDAVGQAVGRGIVVVDVTQCASGEVELGLYEASAGLLARGVVGGMDLSAEAALTKLAFVLGLDADPAVAADLMQINLRGEQRSSRFHLHFGPGRMEPGGITACLPSRPMVQGPARYEPARLERGTLLMLGLGTAGDSTDPIALKAYLDLPEADAQTPEEGNPHFLGRATRDARTVDGCLLFDVTVPALAFVDGRHENVVTIVNTGERPITWDRLDLALRADC